jgi:hypothetical protein
MENGDLRFKSSGARGRNTLEWSMFNMDARTGRLIKSIQKAVFGNGDSTTDDECRKQIVLFVSQKQRWEQFLIVRPIIFRLWQALIDEFCYPTME